MPLQLPQAASGAEVWTRNQNSGDASRPDPTAANIQGDLLSNGNRFGLGEGRGDIHSPHYPRPCRRHTHAHDSLTTLDCGSTEQQAGASVEIAVLIQCEVLERDIFFRLPQEYCTRRVAAIKRIEQVANPSRAPNVAALHFRQAQLAAFDHPHQLFDRGFSHRHRRLPAYLAHHAHIAPRHETEFGSQVKRLNSSGQSTAVCKSARVASAQAPPDADGLAPSS